MKIKILSTDKHKCGAGPELTKQFNEWITNENLIGIEILSTQVSSNKDGTLLLINYEDHTIELPSEFRRKIKVISSDYHSEKAGEDLTKKIEKWLMSDGKSVEILYTEIDSNEDGSMVLILYNEVIPEIDAFIK